MDLFSVLTLLGGLAFFLYGMSVMSSGLEKMAGGKLEMSLKRMTDNPLKSYFLGAGITIAIQSSSAMTVMLVGLVNSGIMQLSQTIGVIMGSNIGTTLTAWLLSLTGIESENVLLQLLKPESFSPVMALIGIVLVMMGKTDRKKNVGSVLVGFAVLMYGMELMKNAVSPLSEMPEFTGMLTAFNNPLLGIAVGTVFTGIIQSSAAAVGILQALALTGSISYQMAIPLIVGANIGTCATALISCIGVNRNAKRVAVVHIVIKVIGMILYLIFFQGAALLFPMPFLDKAASPVGIALAHTVFNVANTMVLTPFPRQLEAIATRLVPDGKKKGEAESYSFIDRRLLATPSVAIAECDLKTSEMAVLAKSTLFTAMDLLQSFDPAKAKQIEENEEQLDLFEDRLGAILVQIASRALSTDDSHRVSKQLHTIGDFERIGDHAVNLLGVAREMHEKSVHFSAEAMRELNVLTNALTEIVELTVDSFCHENLEQAGQVEPLEQVIDQLTAEVKTRHVERLQTGKCTIQMGFILSDILNNYERISDHCSNVAVALIETKQTNYGVHEYLNEIKQTGNPEFETAFLSYRQKYSL